MATKKRSETSILSPEIEVSGFRIRPWTFEQFIDLLPSLIEIGEAIKSKGITLDAIGDLRNNPRLIADIATVLGPFIPVIVSKTLAIEPEKVKGMDFDRVTSIALVILIQNAEKLKNFSGLGKEALRSLMNAV